MGIKPGAQERAQVSKQALSKDSMPAGGSVVVRGASHIAAKRKQQWKEFGRALLYMSPAILFLLAFTYIPFLRSIWLSFFVTNPQGATVRFNDVKYYTRIFNLDGSGRSEYLKSILTTVYFSRVLELLQLNSNSLLQHSSTALLAVAFMTTWTSLGFNFIVTLAGLQAIPQDIYESARIDGANGWKSFRFITLPLLTPTLLFLILISTIQSFQAFTQFNVLIGNEGPDSATNVFVFSIFTAFWKDNRYGFASAMSVVLFLILLVLTFIQYRLLDRRVHYQ